MDKGVPTLRENTAPAPPPLPEFKLNAIGDSMWKAIGESGQIVFRAPSEQEALDKLMKVLDHVVSCRPGPWPDIDIQPQQVEDFI